MKVSQSYKIVHHLLAPYISNLFLPLMMTSFPCGSVCLCFVSNAVMDYSTDELVEPGNDQILAVYWSGER